MASKMAKWGYNIYNPTYGSGCEPICFKVGGPLVGNMDSEQ